MKIDENIIKMKHLGWSMENHPTGLESDQKLKEMLNESVVSWEDESYWFIPLSPNRTGLPVTILLDQGAYVRDLKHPLWLYFRNSYDENENNFLPITISKSPKIIAFADDKINIFRNDLLKIYRFIAKYQKAIQDVAYDRIDIDDFNTNLSLNENKQLITDLIKIDEHGKPIYAEKEPDFLPCAKNPVNGMLRIKNKEGKYNFLTDEGSILSKIWFDNAQNFVLYNGGVSAAYVIINDTPKWLYKNGELKDIEI